MKDKTRKALLALAFDSVGRTVIREGIKLKDRYVPKAALPDYVEVITLGGITLGRTAGDKAYAWHMAQGDGSLDDVVAEQRAGSKRPFVIAVGHTEQDLIGLLKTGATNLGIADFISVVEPSGRKKLENCPQFKLSDLEP